MPRLQGGPADGCEVPGERGVITVRVQDGVPVLDADGRLLVSGIQPRSARGQWEPYVLNRFTREYRYARLERGYVPPWYDALPAHKALASTSNDATT